jgi:F-type H+-transporting ATPase subunit a
MMAPEAAEAAHAAEGAEHHVHSIVYGPVNWVWEHLLYGPADALWQAFANGTGLAGREILGGLLNVPAHLSHEVPDHVAMSLLVMLVIAAIFIPLRFTLKKEKPGKVQQMMELLVEGISDLLEDVVGHGATRRYLPFIGGLAVFIFVANLCGLFFFLQPPTQNTNTTFALSITAFLYYNYRGLKTHGLSYFKQFLGPVLALAPLFIVIEIISHLARALSLSLRLFGNIFGEHAVSGEFFGIAPIVLPIPVMLLGLFAALLQAFIFVMLTMVYLAGAEATEH